MRVSHTHDIEGGRIVRPLGRLRAASSWHAANAPRGETEWRDAALRALIAAAQDCEADAIVSVDYEIDGARDGDHPGVDLTRVCASGLAVRLARN